MELENARLFLTSAQGILARTCVLSEWMFQIGFPASMSELFLTMGSIAFLKILNFLFANVTKTETLQEKIFLGRN